MGKPSWKAMMLQPIRQQEKKLTSAYEQIMRASVAAMPNWTPEAVKSINMRYKDGGHVITYSDDSIIDIENGTPDQDLSPAIRNFMINRGGK
jgi:hypothetical protein